MKWWFEEEAKKTQIRGHKCNNVWLVFGCISWNNVWIKQWRSTLCAKDVVNDK